jgi:hypothetical protein
VVIGAHYTYNSLVTFPDSSSNNNKPVMLPSQYPTTQPPHSSTQSRKHTFSSQHTEKKKNHARSTSHPKSFNAFLKDTNDEWSDDIQATSARHTTEKDPTIDHEALAKATEAVLSVTSPKLPPSAAPPLKKKKSVNPNGIKEHLQDLLLGKYTESIYKEKRLTTYNIDPTFSLKWIDMDDTRDPTRTNKFKEVLSVSNVDLGKILFILHVCPLLTFTIKKLL